jgi:hypothetical protein
MGNRRVIGLRENTESNTLYVYIHWAKDDVMQITKEILEHSEKRWGDNSYANRMAVGYIMANDPLGELGIGLSINKYASPDNDLVPIIVWEKFKVIVTKSSFHETYDPYAEEDQVVSEMTFDEVLALQNQ